MRTNLHLKLPGSYLALALVFVAITSAAFAQGTAFTYQGKLADNGNPANGQYDFQFRLFDMLAGGTQQGSLVPASNVTVTTGIFTVQLDFGACPTCFNGAARFLEIAVKKTTDSTFVTLAPRQPITSTPYSIKTQNLTFNGPFDNGSGTSFTASNSFTGEGAGLNTTPDPALSGLNGKFNSFYGAGAGKASTTGSFNALFGFNAGVNNTTGFANSFFGRLAGTANTQGFGNAFFGEQAGIANTTGNNNSVFGRLAGGTNTTGSRNSLFGEEANSADGLSNATAIGSRAFVNQSNSLVLGGINGFNSGTDTNVGIGTPAPSERLHVVGNGLFTGNVTVNGTLNATLPSGSGNYIQNTASQQANSSFNISGDGTAGGTLSASIVKATTLYNIGTQRVLSVAFNSLFVGINAGTSPNNTGSENAFFGTSAGQANTTGSSNAFFGRNAGNANTTGGSNAFFGLQAGFSNTTGDGNAFFGYLAGDNNTTGSLNAFFGRAAGLNNNGSQNAFFGRSAGSSNSGGQNNTFIGFGADFNTGNPTGDNNTLLGSSTNVNSGVSNGTAIGANASVTTSNSLVLGSINGVNSATADTKVGIGTTTPSAVLDVQRDGTAIPEIARFTSYGNIANDILGRSSNGTRAAPTATTSGTALLQMGATGHDGTNFVSNPRAIIALDSTEDWTTTANGTRIRFRTTANGTTAITTRMTIDQDGQVGIGTLTPADLLHVTGDIRVGTGTTGCVKDSDGTVIAGTCSSDARLKRDIIPFAHLLDKLVQLQPVQFYWRADEFKERHFGTKPSFGLIAQEVERVLPELVSEDEQGYKAVNYSKLPLLTLQAIKELKQENDQLRQQLNEQQQETAAIKKLLCAAQPQADLCSRCSNHQHKVRHAFWKRLDNP